MPNKEKWEILAKEYVTSLFPVFMAINVFSTVKAKKVFGVNLSIGLKVENESSTYLYKPTNWAKSHNFLASQIKKNPDLFRIFFNIIDRLGKKQIDFSKRAVSSDLTKISNQKLNNYYQKYCHLNSELYIYGFTLPVLDFQKTTFLSDEVGKFLKQKKAEKYFSILTTPLQDTFNKKHELNLLKILIQIKKKKRLFDLFKKLNANNLVEVLPRADKKIWQQIKLHTKKYTWVHYVYLGPAADEAYFIDIIRDFIRRRIDPQKEIISHKAEKDKLKIKQQEILTKLKPSKYFRQIIFLARDAVYFKIYRRDIQSASYYYINFILVEIARRLNLSLKQVRMMLNEEIEKGLLKNIVNVDEINQRLKLVVYFTEGKVRKILSGKKALGFVKQIKTEKIKTKSTKIIGTTAQPGKVSGVVKLINSPEDIKKMNQGDILISSATSPNLMPAIRKAGAIITDEGGLTCHAAIVSREFKIPCVVGTVFVTQALKDGDKVEVDATKGIVKKI